MVRSFISIVCVCKWPRSVHQSNDQIPRWFVRLSIPECHRIQTELFSLDSEFSIWSPLLPRYETMKRLPEKYTPKMYEYFAYRILARFQCDCGVRQFSVSFLMGLAGRKEVKERVRTMYSHPLYHEGVSHHQYDPTLGCIDPLYHWN